ncbi:hypothetical protein XaCFBP7622_16495 [Xanthomonas arboricola]|nr:hypothetical protein XaCFBP7622_16495 [Xanthomonas arboricola]
MHTDHLNWSLSAHRRGTLSGMDAAPEPTWTYLRRVLRWWAGKDPAANPQRRARGAHQTWSRYVMSERRIQHCSYRAHRPSR